MSATSDSPDPLSRDLDIVIFGATSFVGELMCRAMVDRHGTNGELRWAIAGRNELKLNKVAGDTGADVEKIVVDAQDRSGLDAMAARARVIVSTVGPYALYGNDLVAACAAAGTDYCDLSGEPQWMRRMIADHESEAHTSGARIVHACGFDSIPSDLGVHHLQQAAIERFGEPCTSVSMRVKAMKGSASGGTLASMLNVVDETKADPGLRKVLANPYALAPEGMQSGVRQKNLNGPARDDVTGAWITPFVMAAINTRIVHRSHALLGQPWGSEFRYDEAMVAGDGPVGAAKAAAVAGGLGAFMAATTVGPLRGLLEDRVLPKPGEGPSPEAQAAGFFSLRFHGSTAGGDTLTTKVTGDRDPGYGSTAKMLTSAATTLLHTDPADVPGGFWTPSTSMGDRLLEDLVEHAGLTFEIDG